MGKRDREREREGGGKAAIEEGSRREEAVG